MMTREEQLEQICRLQSSEIERLTLVMNSMNSDISEYHELLRQVKYWQERAMSAENKQRQVDIHMREMEGQLQYLRDRNRALEQKVKDAEPGLRKRIQMLREENALLKAARKPLKVPA